MKPKGRKDRYTVVPWFNPEQFNKVYTYLYSDSLVKKRWAVDQISIWNTRCYPSLPTAVEATVGIVSTQIQEMLYIADKTFSQELEIQYTYCAALTRFISLILEHHQKATSKISLSVLAAKHNIPAWLVDLRNEAVHSYLPTRSLLNLGAKSALQYLEETFWSKEAKNKKQIIYLPSEKWEKEALDLINRYKDLQFQRIKGSLTRRLSKSLKAVLKKMSSFIFHDREKFIDILVQPGNFISVEDIERFLFPCDITYWFEDNSISVPVKLQQFWLPLLSNIHNKELLPTFLEKLLLAQEDCRNKLCQKLAVAWSIEIFLGPASKCLLARCFKKKGLLICMPSVLYACMKSATPYTKELLNIILFNCKDKENYTKLYFILALYQGSFVSDDILSGKLNRDTDLEVIFTIEDVEDELNEAKAKKMRNGKNENNWSMAPVAMDFSSIPLGSIFIPLITDASKDKQSSDDSRKDQIKLEPSVDDDFIFGENVDPASVEDIIDDENKFTEITIPEDFDMVYRPKK